MHDTVPYATAPAEATPRRVPVWSDEYVQGMERRLTERYDRDIHRYQVRVATAQHAIRMALMALHHGDAERAERELRRAAE